MTGIICKVILPLWSHYRVTVVTNWQGRHVTRLDYYSSLSSNLSYFSRPTSFLQKSSCRVSIEKNILNSSVKWSGVEKLDKSYIFVYFLTHFLFIINTVIRGAHDIHTCVIRKFKSLTYCFLFININTVTRGAHDIRTCFLWEFLTLTYCFV